MAGTDSCDLTIESDTESILSQSEFYQDLFDVPILSGKFIDDNCLQSDVDSDNSDSDYSDTFLAAKYLKPSSTPISPVSVSPPKFDSPISPVSFCPPKLQSFNMEKLGQCRKFSGYSQDNASKFLSEFQSFATLHGLDNSPERKVAAFHLHLQGPALQWFDSLESVLKSSWDNLEPCFRKKYLELGWQSSTVMLESELFQKMSLLPGQSLEDYYSSLSEKGQILKKPDHELMVRFINGLPEKLAFFVRAGNHEDSSAALAAAKMGETFGYRLHDASVSVAAIRPKEVSEISELREQVKTLTTLVQSMSVHGSHVFHNALRHRLKHAMRAIQKDMFIVIVTGMGPAMRIRHLLVKFAFKRGTKLYNAASLWQCRHPVYHTRLRETSDSSGTRDIVREGDTNRCPVRSRR